MLRFLVTSSRRPTPRIRSLVKDLAGILPGAEKFTRGHYSMRELASEALLRGASRVIIVGGRKGNPSIIRVYEVRSGGLDNIVTFIVKGVALSRELRRPLPKEKPTGMIVETDGDPVSDEFADAFIEAFSARVFEEPRQGDIVAVINVEGDNKVRVEYMFRGRLVGPRLKLAKPQSMIKG